MRRRRSPKIRSLKEYRASNRRRSLGRVAAIAMAVFVGAMAVSNTDYLRAAANGWFDAKEAPVGRLDAVEQFALGKQAKPNPPNQPPEPSTAIVGYSEHLAAAEQSLGKMKVIAPPGASSSDRPPSGRSSSPRPSAGTFACGQPYIHDGDYIRCAGQGRSRLYGIDAPEMPGSCRPGRECAPGDPFASRDHLRALIAGKSVECRQVDTDHWGRPVLQCFAEGVDLSCQMVADGYAIRRYRPLMC